MNNQVIIFDTTLRDGEQALSASLTVKEKLQIAYALERLGVDVIEAGFPVSSPGDFESVQTIAKHIKQSRICALARAVEKDIDVAAESLKAAEAFRIHTFISTSTVHVQDKLRRSYDDVIAMGIAAVKRARKYTDDVEFSCEDAGRTPIDNLCRMVEAAINAGANTINIPDTVGYTLPSEFGDIITQLFNRVPNIDKAVISVHCHDDLGMSVANSMAAIQAGARQVEGTINGLGERAGNCALEEIAMIIKTRQSLLGVHTNLKHDEIHRTSKMVSQLCNMPIQANKAIVGSNAFSHSSGIHQDGMLKNKNTYEIMTPTSIGLKNQALNLTSRSGRAAVKSHMDTLGYTEHEYDLDKLYADFLKLADRKGQVFDYDLEALMHFANLRDEDDFFKINYLSVQSGSVMATTSIKLQCGEEEKCEAAVGNGPVDALYQCIYRLTGYEIVLDKFDLTAKGEGEDGLGQADIIANYKGRKYHGTGLATDIVEASGQALIHVINSIHRANQIATIKQQNSL
ncbi:2-isopropylmalate synthase [Photobacterium phosphoreum]|jgi:2-isopropylmalate synthase|uniref:2-isopropylmalate synthase n=1 Tax=Photobacterium phosphoreum TaxID=659 RepID=UPI0007F86E8C|nr:2-isopropylmalate synthase [Photobacterium phosphoreum]MCD9464429.1 2-isopropylmalate synthase [Photobacterium phosphoreum]MCD9479992.1 2-isopropylmalate synthase [Photobacterium phosphoreum]MCD9507856.1 2-isopropylmalate synthase [Photobacterium phosphoreum]OBU37079.1 2-isopropylmalate synthase [Photobacterium phosphoreum]OBU39263.1 2-isopropylmalate synthase [Photobacterium phosphoreum]